MDFDPAHVHTAGHLEVAIVSPCLTQAVLDQPVVKAFRSGTIADDSNGMRKSRCAQRVVIDAASIECVPDGNGQEKADDRNYCSILVDGLHHAGNVANGDRVSTRQGEDGIAAVELAVTIHSLERIRRIPSNAIVDDLIERGAWPATKAALARNEGSGVIVLVGTVNERLN